MRKRIIIIGLAAVMLTGMVMGLSGCGKKEETVSQTVDDNDRVDIGLSIDSLVIERWQRERDLFVNKATEL